MGLCQKSLDSTHLGIYFRKSATFPDHIIRATLNKASPNQVYTSKVVTSETTYKLSFYFDGTTYIEFFIDDEWVASRPFNNINLMLTPTILIQNGDAVSNILSVDYIRVIQER